MPDDGATPDAEGYGYQQMPGVTDDGRIGVRGCSVDDKGIPMGSSFVQVVLFAIIASSALVIGAAVGVRWTLGRRVTAWLLAFASGALVSAVAFELFDDAYQNGGAWRAGSAFIAGATVFIVIDTILDKRTEQRHSRGAGVGLALLAGVTLDGVPENMALGVSLIEGSAAALLVAIFVSNFPEAVVGAQKMKDAGMAGSRIVLTWTVAAVVLSAAVVVGNLALDGVAASTLAWPLGFAAGAVLASLADTLMPEAYREGGPTAAYATALGFLSSFLISAV